MNKGICTVSVAALRSEPSHRAEMTSQLLYGETVKILANEGKFLKVQMDFDGYEGWVDAQQISESFESVDKTVVQETFLKHESAEGEILLSIGSEIKSENIAVEQPKKYC